MSNFQAMWFDSAAALAALVAFAFATQGAGFAFGVGVSGLAAIANLALMYWLVSRIVSAMAAGKSSAGVGLLLGGKLVIILGVVFALLQFFPGEAVAMGVASTVLGMSMVPVRDLLFDSEDPSDFQNPVAGDQA